MNKIEKAFMLARTALKDPSEFFDRIEAIITTNIEPFLMRKEHQSVRRVEEVYPDIEKIFKARIDWSEADEVEQELQSRIAKLKASAPFRTSHNADFSLARLAYALCRLLKPEVVLETGVAYGVMSSFILKAMACNQLGQLISIDLPPLGKHSDSFVGFLIPERYKSRWQLHRGSSKRLLPRLLPQIGRVDFFIHDSLHTYWNIRRELFTVTPYLSRRSAVLLDDVDGNRAFSEWIAHTHPQYSTVFRQTRKQNVGGVAIFV